MNFRHRRIEEPEINLIPFIDVLLVILIFLMLSTTYSKYSELQITLPVADAEDIDLRYRTPLGLVADLRAAGETNAVLARDTRTPPRDLFPLAAARLATPETGIPATFRLLVLTGWAPSATQSKPARPGSATTRLAEALGTVERSAGEKTGH